ncbi:ABC transporter substrate-binding protein [Jiangella aurantiaca]|nr:extracellular solute-binding protein [Jiangella aurantiaca]
MRMPCQPPRRPRTSRSALVIAGTVGLALVACAPGGDVPAAESAGPVSTELSGEPVELTMVVESTAPVWKALAEEFERQHPQVTVEVRQDEMQVLVQNAPRLLAGDDPPDLIHLSPEPDLVRDGLLTDLDDYAAAYGWDELPASHLDPMRIDADAGRAGTGSLYGIGLLFGVHGIYYNEELAARIGMTAPPETLAEFEGLLADAAEAGIQPIVQANVGGIAMFPLQTLLNQHMDQDELADWIYNAPDATIQTDGAVEAAAQLQDWANQGYLSPDANAVDYTTMLGRFTAGEALFLVLGDWEAANLDGAMGTNVGFFAAPPLEEGGRHVAVAGPAAFVVAANSDHPDEAAYFLDWAQTDPAARQLIVDIAGSFPGGSPDLSAPRIDPDSVLVDTQRAFEAISAYDGAVPVLSDATPGMFVSTLGPELQLLLAGRSTPEQFIARIQAGYEEDLGR